MTPPKKDYIDYIELYIELKSHSWNFQWISHVCHPLKNPLSEQASSNKISRTVHQHPIHVCFTGISWQPMNIKFFDCKMMENAGVFFAIFNGFLKTIGTCDFEVTKRGESSLILSANLMSYHAQNTTIFRISNILLHHGTRNKTKLIHSSAFKLFTQVYGKTAVRPQLSTINLFHCHGLKVSRCWRYDAHNLGRWIRVSADTSAARMPCWSECLSCLLVDMLLHVTALWQTSLVLLWTLNSKFYAEHSKRSPKHGRNRWHVGQCWNVLTRNLGGLSFWPMPTPQTRNV